MMKSGKQKAEQIKTRRAKAREVAEREQAKERLRGKILVNMSLLESQGSYSITDFEIRGYYLDVEFRCIDCGKEEIWSATQQKWWYEVAKGHKESTAVRCRNCRRKERQRKANASETHLSGLVQRGET